MTHDPRLPTLEQVMNGNNPFEIISTLLGSMERWRAEAMLIGTTSGIQDVYRTIRDDAIAQAARADATEARNALILNLCAKVDAAHTRLDHLVAELAAEREARRADEARKAKFDEEPLALPPGKNEPEPVEIKDDEPPIGISKDPGELPEPPLELGDKDNLGDLPEELRDLPDPPAKPKGSVLPPPIALFGN